MRLTYDDRLQNGLFLWGWGLGPKHSHIVKLPSDDNVQKGDRCGCSLEKRNLKRETWAGALTQLKGALSSHRRDAPLGACGGHGHGPPHSLRDSLGSDPLLRETS